MNLSQLEAQYKKLGEEINNLKNPPEEFYKIGDVFKIEGYNDYYVLSQTSTGTYAFVGITRGNIWSETIYSDEFYSYRIPKSFVSTLASGGEFTKVTIKITEQPEADKDGWIEWSGGECPVSCNTLVQLEFRDGSVHSDVAAEWAWAHKNSLCDIIAYRVLK